MRNEKTRWIISIAIALFGIFVSLFFNREKKTILDIEKVNETQLTKSLNVKGLSSMYLYNDSIEVQNLWQSTFVIRNIGRKTIYGEGFTESSIRGSHIPLIIENCATILSVDITNNNCGATLRDTLNLIIKQWKPKEYVEITILTDGENSPNLTISDRDIADSQITYSVYSPEITDSNYKLIDYLPEEWRIILKWITVLCIALYTVTNIFGILDLKSKGHPKGIMILSVISIIIIQIGLLLPLLWIIP
jgi:hypothetical protein